MKDAYLLDLSGISEWTKESRMIDFRDEYEAAWTEYLRMLNEFPLRGKNWWQAEEKDLKQAMQDRFQSPAYRIEAVENLINDELISIQEGRKLLGFPDEEKRNEDKEPLRGLAAWLPEKDIRVSDGTAFVHDPKTCVVCQNATRYIIEEPGSPTKPDLLYGIRSMLLVDGKTVWADECKCPTLLNGHQNGCPMNRG